MSIASLAVKVIWALRVVFFKRIPRRKVQVACITNVVETGVSFVLIKSTMMGEVAVAAIAVNHAEKVVVREEGSFGATSMCSSFWDVKIRDADLRDVTSSPSLQVNDFRFLFLMNWP